MGLILGGGTTKPQYSNDMWYGVEGDFTSKDYKLTRIGNMDLHRSQPIQKKLRRFVENPDGSVKYYLHEKDSRLKENGEPATLDSTDGNVMLEKPEYFCKFEVNGTKWAMCISEQELPGFVKMERKTLSPWYATVDIANSKAVSGCWLQWDNNNELLRDENGYISLLPNATNFRGGQGWDSSRDGNFNSMLGMPRTMLSKDQVRTLCQDGTHFGVARAYMEIAWLQRIEYASLNCKDEYTETLTTDGFRQGGLGSCATINYKDWRNWNSMYPFIPSGVTATLGNNTGQVSYTIKGWAGLDKAIQCASYRGLELPFGYLNLFADDILAYFTVSTENTESSCIMYGCSDPNKFTAPDHEASGFPTGYEAIGELPREEGTIHNFNFSNGFTYPTSIVDFPNQGMCDYIYVPSVYDTNGWFAITLSGCSTDGNSTGWGFMRANEYNFHVGSYTAFRLCRF